MTTALAVGAAPMMAMEVIGGVHPQPDGTVTVYYPDGQVLSVQPDGHFEKRPAGTAGPYECARVTHQGLLYAPGGAHVFLVPLCTL